MHFRLSRASFWLAAVAAAWALLAPRGHETLLMVVTTLACAVAFLLWRSGVKTQARTHAAESAVPLAPALNQESLRDAADMIERQAQAAPNFEAALHAVAQVLRSELGVREVAVHRVREIGPSHAQISTLIESHPHFQAVPRGVRLDAIPLGRAVTTQREAGRPPGAVALPVLGGERVVALIELTGIELAVEPQALAGLLELARVTLSQCAPPALPSLPDQAASAAPADGHVLVVEDNLVNPERTTRLLRRLGCRVTPASGMLEGLNALSGTQFDLVLVDVGLSGADPRRFASVSAAPLIAVTNPGLPVDAQRLRELGFDDHVCKPIRQAQMLALLSKHLRPHAPAESGGAGAGADGASSGDDSAPVLDPAALARLKELDPTGANHLLERVLKAFQTSVARLRPQADAARASGDHAGLRLVAHTLKSSSASIGAMHLSQLCAQIETTIRTASGDDLESQLDAFDAALDSALQAIAKLLEASA